MAGQRLVLDEAVAHLLIGSDPSCDFYLPHDSVSPIHGRLWVDLDGTVLHDTNSPYGLYVNDERVVGKHELHNGDIVWLGSPGGANVVMIQCVLAEKTGGTEEAAIAEPPSDGAAEREALESLAPTLAAGPTLADFDSPRASEGSVPVWDEEAPAIPEPAPPPDADDDISRTQAFKPADFAAALAYPPPIPRAAPPPPVPASDRSDEMESLVDEPAQPEFQEHTAVLPEDETLVDAHAYGSEPEPVLAPPPEPVTSEPEPYVAAEPETEVIEPILPEPDATHLIVASEGMPAPAPPASDLPDFDDMMFSVPDEAPAAAAAPPPPAPPAAVAPPEPPPDDETVLLPSMPRPAPAPPPPAPAPPVAAQPPAPPRPAAPKPAPARAAATSAATPTPRPAPARPAVRAERAATQAPPTAPSKGLPMAALAGAGVLVVVMAAAGYWVLGRSEPAQTAAIPEASPSTVAATLAAPVTTLATLAESALEPTPEPAPAMGTVAPGENVVTIVRTASPPPRAPSAAAATPRPAEARRPDPVDPAAATRARLAAQVTTLLGQAQSAVSARNYDAALVQYDEVLRLDPQNAGAQAGKTAATTARAHARKTFVAGRTVVRTEKAGGGLAGFDSSGVNLQKAPDFQGRVEYAMTPASVQPGDPWELKIYVVNEGKKAIKIATLDVATVVNGAPSGTGGAPKNREIAPQQRVIVDQLSGTWPAGVTSWRTEVKVAAGKNDSLQSQLTWR